MTSRPLSVGSFFTSRSRLRSNMRAVASSRSTSSRPTSLIEQKRLLGGGPGGRRPSRMTRISAIVRSLLWSGNEQHLVDLVHLDELHLDALGAGGRQGLSGRGGGGGVRRVLAAGAGGGGPLRVPAVEEPGELDPRRPAVVEERLDRRSDRPA